jgi:hypothetical protein
MGVYRFLVGEQGGKRDHWGGLGVDKLIILGWICGKMCVCMFFLGKQKGKRPLGKTRRRWVDNIRMDLLGERVYCFFMGKPELMRPLGRPRRI